MNGYIRSRAPLRIGIAGGGTDVNPYAKEKGGCVFNTTINKYAYCTLVPSEGKTITVDSFQYGRYKTSLKNTPLRLNGNMDLIKSVSNYFELDRGFKMTISSDVPAGSGLGGSSTMMIAMIATVAEWIGKDMSKKEMAKLAYHLEREIIGLKGGVQDQYAAAYGGFNYLDVNDTDVSVRKAKVDKDVINELQCRSILCYTKMTRESANIIDSQMKSTEKGSNIDALDAAKALAIDIGRSIEDGDLDSAGRLLDQSWAYKKQFSSNVSNKKIDKLYTIAKNNGALGGKVSGAGGGGFMYFICRYDKKNVVSQALKDAGGELMDFSFDPNGVTTWKYGTFKDE